MCLENIFNPFKPGRLFNLTERVEPSVCAIIMSRSGSIRLSPMLIWHVYLDGIIAIHSHLLAQFITFLCDKNTIPPYATAYKWCYNLRVTLIR
jgi:hypothetical protein